MALFKLSIYVQAEVVHNFSEIPDLIQVDTFLAEYPKLQSKWRGCFQIAASLARSSFFLQVVYKSDEELLWAREAGLLIAQRTDINISESIRKYEYQDDFPYRSGIHTVLGYVCSKEDLLEVVRALLSRNDVLRYINAKDNIGATPLHDASMKGRTEVVNLLIEKGADIHVKNKNGYTALHYASMKGRTEVVNLLIEKGADINVKNNNGLTPLCWASRNGLTEVVNLLIEKGADIHVKEDNNGRTPLHWASYKGHTEVVNLLIEKGADTHVKSKYGITPLCYATNGGHTEVVNLFIEKGADNSKQCCLLA
jgi:hypothetical protein